MDSALWVHLLGVVMLLIAASWVHLLYGVLGVGQQVVLGESRGWWSCLGVMASAARSSSSFARSSSVALVILGVVVS